MQKFVSKVPMQLLGIVGIRIRKSAGYSLEQASARRLSAGRLFENQLPKCIEGLTVFK